MALRLPPSLNSDHYYNCRLPMPKQATIESSKTLVLAKVPLFPRLLFLKF